MEEAGACRGECVEIFPATVSGLGPPRAVVSPFSPAIWLWPLLAEVSPQQRRAFSRPFSPQRWPRPAPTREGEEERRRVPETQNPSRVPQMCVPAPHPAPSSSMPRLQQFRKRTERETSSTGNSWKKNPPVATSLLWLLSENGGCGEHSSRCPRTQSWTLIPPGSPWHPSQARTVLDILLDVSQEGPCSLVQNGRGRGGPLTLIPLICPSAGFAHGVLTPFELCPALFQLSPPTARLPAEPHLP